MRLKPINLNSEDPMETNKTTLPFELAEDQNISLTAIKGNKPVLPNKITAETMDGITKEVNVVWNEISEESYSKVGTFTVEGNISGTSNKVIATIIVKEIASVDTLSSKIGSSLVLPAELNVEYTDGTKELVSVTWDVIDESVFQTEGVHSIKGKIKVSGTIVELNTNINVAEGDYASDIEWKSATVGWGSIQKDKSNGGNPLKLILGDKVTTFKKGIGTHTDSTIIYDVTDKNYKYFQSYVGNDQEMSGSNSDGIRFKVYVDSELKYDSEIMKPNTPAKFISLDIEGAKEVKLVADKVVNNGSDHADWADTVFVNAAKEEVEVNPDFNNNGKIDLGDLSIISKNYGKNVKEFDLNKDGKIDEYEIKFITDKLLEN